MWRVLYAKPTSENKLWIGCKNQHYHQLLLQMNLLIVITQFLEQDIYKTYLGDHKGRHKPRCKFSLFQQWQNDERIPMSIAPTFYTCLLYTSRCV